MDKPKNYCTYPKSTDPIKLSRDKKWTYQGKDQNSNSWRRNSGSNSSSNPTYPIIKTTVDKLDLATVKSKRAGIVIYTTINDCIYFGFGLDSRTHDLTDFGGHVEYIKDSTPVHGAIREFEEETLNIFVPFDIKDIKQCLTIYDLSNLIIFVRMNVDPEKVCVSFNKQFQQSISKNNDIPEVCGITWLTYEEFRQNIIKEGTIFEKVRNFLFRAGDFFSLL